MTKRTVITVTSQINEVEDNFLTNCGNKSRVVRDGIQAMMTDERYKKFTVGEQGAA